MSRRFSEMNQAKIGVIGLVTVALVAAVSLNIGAIRGALFGTVYSAVFKESGGLGPGDDVRIAGMTVGSVRSVEIEGTAVTVEFTVEESDLGRKSAAAIKSDNALGRKYLQVVPAGEGRLEKIPLERTTSPYGVTEALGDLSANTAEIDVDQLEKSLTSLTTMFTDTPDEFRQALQGVARLSTSISSRDTQLAALFEKARSVTGVIADRNAELMTLMSDGSAFFSEIQSRRQVIHSLLVNAHSMATELEDFVDDNVDELGPTLDALTKVTIGRAHA